MTKRFLLPAVSLLVVCSPVRSENWPGWRGPRGDGTSAETNIAKRWSNTEPTPLNVGWATAIPGKGHSSPVVWDYRVFLTSCLEKEGVRLLLCLNRNDGSIIWQREVVKAPLEGKHRLNSYASSTPATDGKHVWVSFLAEPNMIVVCYDLDGKEIWRKSPGEFHSVHGFCSPPILYKDMVILNGDQDADAWIVALDKATGRERWRADRPNKTRSYCPPLIVEAGGKKQLVLTGSKCVASYNPDTGEQNWLIDGPTEQFVASMVFLDGVFFLTSGYPEYHIMAIDPAGKVLWHQKGPSRYLSYVPSPIAFGKWFFLVSDQGYASCWEAKTGELCWRQRLGRHHSASPVLADGHIYFVDDDGKTFVIKAADKFELVSKNDLNEECYASPAIAQGFLFIRTAEKLYCIGSGIGPMRRR